MNVDDILSVYTLDWANKKFVDAAAFALKGSGATNPVVNSGENLAAYYVFLAAMSSLI